MKAEDGTGAVAEVMGNAEIINDFLIESQEGLDRLDQELVALEQRPKDREILDSIFRTIHSIKGTSGLLAFNKLERVAHMGESLLVRLRDGRIHLNPAVTTALLAMVDALRRMLTAIEESGNEGEWDDRELIGRFTRLLDSPSAAGGAAAPEDSRELTNIGEILVGKGVATRSAVQEAIDQQSAGDPRHVGEILVEKGAVKPQDVVEALHSQQRARAFHASDRSIRVEVVQLDRLRSDLEDLALLRNQVVNYTSAIGDRTLNGIGEKLDRLVTELEKNLTKMQMQPIGNLWSKFPRTVREMAIDCGKQIRVEMDGEETEIDKRTLDALKDPLTHLVRNAVDHGIEPGTVRMAAGKSMEGCVLLRAFSDAGQINVEVGDDGAGLDLAAIRKKAVEMGLVSAHQKAKMSEREIASLIFSPGLSTSERVTHFSGRGVGMDVVKTNVERVGGAVEVLSRPGRGCTVRMRIPLRPHLSDLRGNGTDTCLSR